MYKPIDYTVTEKYTTMSDIELKAKLTELEAIGYDNFTYQQEYEYGLILVLLAVKGGDRMSIKFINHPPPSNYEKFYNTANFKEFLDDNLKADYYDFDAYLKELVSKHYQTGTTSFELGCHETKSGNPVVFDYDVIYYADDNYEETDGWEEEVSQWFEIYIF